MTNLMFFKPPQYCGQPVPNTRAKLNVGEGDKEPPTGFSGRSALKHPKSRQARSLLKVFPFCFPLGSGRIETCQLLTW